MLWLALHFPLLPLEALYREPDTRPLAVTCQQRILCANPAAMATGIRAGTPLTVAQMLCPNLRWQPRQDEAEERLHAQLGQSLLSYSPMVHLALPDSVLLEISGCLTLFKGLKRLLYLIRETLQQAQMTHSSHLGHTPEAALLLARLHQPLPESWQLMPPSCETVMQALTTLPLQGLPLEESVRSAMQRPGFACLGEILSLPSPAVRRRFGKTTSQWLERLRGDRPDPRKAIIPQLAYAEEQHFFDSIEHSQGLIFPMHRMLESFCRFLQQRQLQGPQLYWDLYMHRYQGLTLEINVSQPLPDKQHYLHISQLLLDSLTLEHPVSGLRLRAGHLQARELQALTLFPSPGDTAETGVLGLLDRLRSRLGHDHCHFLDTKAHHLPEAQQQLISTLSPCTQPSSPVATAQRPLWLLPQPARLTQVPDMPPRGMQRVSEVERLQLPWWEQAGERAYVIARRHDGALLWIFLNGHDRLWYLHGIFA